MAKIRSAIGRLDRRPTFYNSNGFTQDDGGGTKDVITEQWNAWAEIQDRTGTTFLAQGTELSTYDYRVRVRFDGRFNSQTTMVYEGQVCKCNSMSIEREGYKDFLNLQYTKTDTFIDLS